MEDLPFIFCKIDKFATLDCEKLVKTMQKIVLLAAGDSLTGEKIEKKKSKMIKKW